MDELYYGRYVRRFHVRPGSDDAPCHNHDVVMNETTTTRAPRTSGTTTRGIRIEVRSEFLPERSSVKDGSYLFLYHVRISNVGTETAQLLSREWIITNADGEVERVKGPGVVGEYPVLPPGGSFEYTSYCPLKTAVGSMQGSYQMVTADGERFDAMISPFTLAVPNALN